MAAASVSADNTRVNAADANTDWSNLGGGGPAPAAEAQLKYQGTNAVNRKVTASTAREGVQYDPGANALDMTAAANRLVIIKGYVADFGDLNATYGIEARVGSGSGAYYHYNIAGSGANRSVFTTYPAQGGYLIVAIDPNIAGWREGTTGSPSLTAVDYFGFAAQFINGVAKSENLAMDAIDVGTGLTIVGGDGGDPDAVFLDFVDADQGTVNNRWGYVTSASGIIYARGMLTIGTATATVFTDNEGVVVFPDGYHSAGLFGVTVDLQNASTAVTIGGSLLGRGSATTEDTRPDLVVTGTSGTFDLNGIVLNHRNITLTSACTVDGAEIECQLLTQSTADIVNSIIRTNSLTSVACLQDPTFGASSGLRDCEFVQVGAGHAIEIDTAGTYTFTNLTFTGYGADTTDSAAIDVTETTGTVTINWSGGTQPTYKTAGATVVIQNAVTVEVTVVDNDTKSAISGARVLVEADSGGDLPAGESVTLTRSGSTVTVSHTGHGIPDGTEVVIRGANEDEYNGIFTITVTGANSYTYTIAGTPASPATGTITSTAVIISGTTNVSGVIQNTGFSYTSDQPIVGKARSASGSPYYKTSEFVGTIGSAGLSLTTAMILDE